MRKKTLPLSKVYGLIEPGPVVLLTTAHAARSNVMTMSWQTMLDFEPPLIGCVVSNRNYSYGLLRASRACAINIPAVELASQVVGCGNTSGERIDKFKRFGLTRVAGEVVEAPLIGECFASLECQVVDTTMVTKYCLFVVQVVKAWATPGWKSATTLHHLGHGNFVTAAERIKLRSKMK